MSLASKTKEQTDYLFNQIEPFLDEQVSLNERIGSSESKDVKKIIYKILKVFNQGK